MNSRTYFVFLLISKDQKRKNRELKEEIKCIDDLQAEISRRLSCVSVEEINNKSKAIENMHIPRNSYLCSKAVHAANVIKSINKQLPINLLQALPCT